MDIYEFFAQHNIAYQRHDHPPMYTVAQANRLVPPLPTAKTKNLFLKDRKGRQHFLVVVPGDKRVDLAALSAALAVKKLGFASEERLKHLLGIEPGAVSILAVFNDRIGVIQDLEDRETRKREADMESAEELAKKAIVLDAKERRTSNGPFDNVSDRCEGWLS